MSAIILATLIGLGAVIPSTIAIPGPDLVVGQAQITDAGFSGLGANITNAYHYNATIGGKVWIGNQTDIYIDRDSNGHLHTNGSIASDAAITATTYVKGATAYLPVLHANTSISTGTISSGEITSTAKLVGTHAYIPIIQANTSIGINEDTPEKLLHISSTGSSQILLEDTDQADNANPYWAIESSGGSLRFLAATRSAGSIATTTERVAVNGGVLRVEMIELPDAGDYGVCDATKRGRMTFDAGGASVADTLLICMKSNADTYSWKTAATG